MDSIICGIIMIVSSMIIFVVASVLSVIVIGVFIYILYFVVWGWSVYWGIRAYQVSAGSPPLEFHKGIPVIGAMGGSE
jgi:hypothetical protein